MAKLLILLFLTCILGTSIQAGDRDGTVSVTIPAGVYTIEQTDRGDEIRMEGFGRRPEPGVPMLPARIFAVAVPPGARVTGASFHADREILLDGTYAIPPVPQARVLTQDASAQGLDPAVFDANHRAVYDRDAFFPATPGELVRPASYRGYDLADVRIEPFAWNPESGELVFRPTVTVTVSYELPEEARDVVQDRLVRTEELARDIIVNYAQAQQWYGKNGLAAGRGLHEFVIITPDWLTTAVQPIVDGEIGKGRTVNVVTTSWIQSNYSGYDLAEKMRNFLRTKYPSSEWGIEDVLLVGHYDDVVMRRCEQDIGYGRPETDFYYAELSLPDSQSWDSDGDRLWGENTDPIDFYNEVNVGRIPWSDASTVQAICDKSVAFENNNDHAFKKNILLLGAYFWPNTDNAVLMERKVNETWMSDWTMTRMYEQGYSAYSADHDLTHGNVRSVWGAGKYVFVNWAGHGSATSSHIYYNGSPSFVSTSTCSYLNDDYPSIIFADACSNADTDHNNIGRAMIKRGGVGFVGATKVALGMPGWNSPSDGSSQSMDYYFTTAVTSGNYTQGEAHQLALRTMYVYGLWSLIRYETFEWGCLQGSPSIAISRTIADFSAAPTTGDFPLTVAFTDESTGEGIAFWSWEFGDGVISLARNPVHEYELPGAYTVSLTVMGLLGQNTKTRTEYIVVTGAGAWSRNGSGVNPEIYTSTSMPYLGTFWTSEIDGGSVGASGLTFVVGYSGPLSGVPTPVGELLIDVATPWILTDISGGGSGISPHSVLIPNDPALAGFPVYTQGLLNNVGGSAQLTNAIDLVLGA